MQQKEPKVPAAYWRHLALSLGVMLALTLFVRDFQIPNPNMILITGLAVFTSLYGYGAGIACGAVMVLYSMYFFSTGHNFVTYDALNLKKMAVITLGVVLNVLFIGHLKKVHTDAERQLIELNAVLKSDNLTLEQVSALDGLTGTRNRYAFRRDYLKYEGRNIHVMMFDLDNFKGTNDTYGHAVGDFVLKSTGRFLREAFGDAHCYRYGGDEFVVICPDRPEAAFVADLEGVQAQMRGLSLDG
ncbi:MAG: diguanylate cyclase, partial [Oscillibacter sp.]|nr:diguanylate cyclase [Oscillibacter sp.]